MRRATPVDFPRVWDLVNVVWGRNRPHAAFAWLYLRNPAGFARSTVVFEKSSGHLVSSATRFPWPVAHGSDRLEGEFGGDTVTVPRLQRTGLTAIRRGPGKLHRWRDSIVILAAPNEKSRSNALKQGDVLPLGPLPSATMILDFQRFLAARSVPAAIARTVGVAATRLESAKRRRYLVRASDIRIEEIRKFDSSIDPITERCMRTDAYWCPHDAEFLNWRYLDHPLHDYVAIALLRNENILAYGVMRIEGSGGLLMEFAAGEQKLARALLGALVDTAREAGIDRLAFYATSIWRYWPLFRQAGFRRRPAERYIKADCASRPDVPIETNWQLLPGDSDVT